MTFKELNRDQLTELKQAYLCGQGNPSWEDLANADELVSDEAIEQEYGSTVFSSDDFMCSVEG